jgi:hypothetical protein
MAKPKSPVQRFSMMWSPGQTTSLGYWPPELETNGTGWAPQSFQVHRETLAIAKRYSDQNESLFAAQQANTAPPDLGDLVTRRQRAMADYKRLAELGNKLSAIDKSVTQKQSQLRAFDYSNDSIRDAMLRQERRSHMRNNMTEEERKNALRDYEWRKAALETDASLSGIAPTFHKAIEDETLRMRYGAELQGISEGRAAIEAVSTAMDAAAKALEHELKVTETAVPGPAPVETPAWVKED